MSEPTSGLPGVPPPPPAGPPPASPAAPLEPPWWSPGPDSVHPRQTFGAEYATPAPPVDPTLTMPLLVGQGGVPTGVVPKTGRGPNPWFVGLVVVVALALAVALIWYFTGSRSGGDGTAPPVPSVTATAPIRPRPSATQGVPTPAPTPTTGVSTSPGTPASSSSASPAPSVSAAWSSPSWSWPGGWWPTNPSSASAEQCQDYRQAVSDYPPDVMRDAMNNAASTTDLLSTLNGATALYGRILQDAPYSELASPAGTLYGLTVTWQTLATAADLSTTRLLMGGELDMYANAFDQMRSAGNAQC